LSEVEVFPIQMSKNSVRRCYVIRFSFVYKISPIFKLSHKEILLESEKGDLGYKLCNNPVGKIVEKAVYRIVFFDNMALYFECRNNKNALLQTFFWRFCPLGCCLH